MATLTVRMPDDKANRAARGSRERGLADLRDLDARDKTVSAAGHGLHEKDQNSYTHQPGIADPDNEK